MSPLTLTRLARRYCGFSALTLLVPVTSPSQQLASTSANLRTMLGDNANEKLPSRTPDVGSVKTFMFGHSEPVLTCTVLRACLVELEAGELLVDEPIAGDQARWIIVRARAGAGGLSTLVIVKPKACDVSTNLVLSTDRRIYDLDLESPSCKGAGTNPKRSYTRHIRFDYPDDSLRLIARAAPSSARVDGADVREVSVDSSARDTTLGKTVTLNSDYGVVRRRRGPFGLFGSRPVDFPWVPSEIADDAAHVYITLPQQAKQHAAPVLYALEDDGSRTMMNFATRDSVIVTDRIFRRGLFVLTSGRREHRLEFVNRSWGKPSQATRRK